MSRVTVTLNGRDFTIGCEEGQEAYLGELAATLDERVRDISGQVGQIGDLRLLLMASLTLVDDLRESDGRVEALDGELQRSRHENHGAASMHSAARTHLAHQLSRLAERMESFADAFEVDDFNAGSDGERPEDNETLAEAGA